MTDNVLESIISIRTFTPPDTASFDWQIAYPIQVRWKSGDFDEAERTSTGASGSSTASDTGVRGGLSTGAIVGIVVGTVIFLLLVAALVGALLFIVKMRRRQAQQLSLKQQLPMDWQGGGAPLPPHQGMAVGDESRYLVSQETQQIDGRPEIPPRIGPETTFPVHKVELDSRRYHSELDGGGYNPEHASGRD